MESKGVDALSNTTDAPEKDQTLILTLNQDQEGTGDANGTIKRLRDEIQALRVQKGELELRLDDARKKLHRAKADYRSLAAEAQHLEDELIGTEQDLAVAAFASKNFETEAARLKQSLEEQEDDVASLTTAKAAMETQISILKERLLYQEEVKALQAKIQALESKDIDLLVETMDSMEQLEAAVKHEIEITEARQQEMQQVVKALEETNIRLEMELAECRSQIDRHLEIQGGHDAVVAAKARRLKVSRVVAAATSVGTLAAVAAAVYLHCVMQR